MTFDPYGPTDDLANIVIDSAALANDGDDRYGPNAPSFLIALRSGVSTRMPERRVLTVQDSKISRIMWGKVWGSRSRSV